MDVGGAIRHLARYGGACAASLGLLVPLVRLCHASPAFSGLLRESLVPGCLQVAVVSSGELSRRWELTTTSSLWPLVMTGQGWE